MRVTITWDDYEIALLIEFVIGVRNNTIDAKSGAQKLSEKLRQYGVDRGIEIDTIYRNVSGMMLQSEKLLYFISDGKSGLSGGSKDFKRVAEIYKSNTEEFTQLLEEAHRVIDGGEVITKEESRKKGFRNFADPEGKSPEMVDSFIVAMDFAAKYTVAYSFVKENLWEKDDADEIEKYISSLFAIKLFSVFHSKEKEILKKYFCLYREFLNRQNGSGREKAEPHTTEMPSSQTAVCEEEQQCGTDQSKDAYYAEKSPLVYRKLFAASQLYDNPAGLTVDEIFDRVGHYCSDDRLIEILDNVSWAKKLSYRRYTFSKAVIDAPEYSKSLQSHDQDGSSYDGIDLAALYDRLVEIAGTCADLEFEISYIEHSLKSASGGIIITDCNKTILEIYAGRKGAYKTEYFSSHDYDLWCATTKVWYNSFKEKFPAIAKKLIYRIEWECSYQIIALTPDTVVSFFSIIASADALPQPAVVSKNVEEKKPSGDNVNLSAEEKDRYVRTLMSRFRGGMRFDSIDFENFRTEYDCLFDEQVQYDDMKLESKLKLCGIMYKDRLFPANAIIDPPTAEKIYAYIDAAFASGVKTISYKALFDDRRDVLAYCFLLTDEIMLREFLKFTAEKDKYFFHEEYLSRERNVKIDHKSEIAEYLIGAGKPLSYAQVYAGLSHIPQEKIRQIIRSEPVFICNEREVYFHRDIFDFDENMRKSVIAIFDGEIEDAGYAMWPVVRKKLRAAVPELFQNNPYLYELGIRNVLAETLSKEYRFQGDVITKAGMSLTVSNLYASFASHNAPFVRKDLLDFMDSIGGKQIYYDAVCDVTVRASDDLFIPKDAISFNADAVDRAIDTYMNGDYMPIREMDSFLVFPAVGYEWNEYLLGSYLRSYSKRYMFITNGLTYSGISGGVVKKQSGIKDFLGLTSAALADSRISLTVPNAVAFLYENGYVSTKHYANAEKAIAKAKEIRVKRGDG